jgi:hypothetical protein
MREMMEILTYIDTSLRMREVALQEATQLASRILHVLRAQPQRSMPEDYAPTSSSTLKVPSSQLEHSIKAAMSHLDHMEIVLTKARSVRAKNMELEQSDAQAKHVKQEQCTLPEQRMSQERRAAGAKTLKKVQHSQMKLTRTKASEGRTHSMSAERVVRCKPARGHSATGTAARSVRVSLVRDGCSTHIDLAGSILHEANALLEDARWIASQPFSKDCYGPTLDLSFLVLQQEVLGTDMVDKRRTQTESIANDCVQDQLTEHMERFRTLHMKGMDTLNTTKATLLLKQLDNAQQEDIMSLWYRVNRVRSTP